MPKLVELGVKLFRSKNADPFMTSIDVGFSDREGYEAAKNSGQLTVENIAKIYKVPREVIHGVFFIDQILAVKISIFKYGSSGYHASGDPECPDHYGAQQHVPLLYMDL